MADEPYKYWAFISYSHQDSAWATWLHRALEGYVVPRRLVGRETAVGPIPRRLFPVFRDRDELSSSAELGGVINEALRRSRCQIVICSPRAATSRWVNEEIRYFKSLGREHRVLALIVDGEPGAADRGEPAFECFPLALRRQVGTDGRIGDAPTEPIAADLRRRHGTRAEARLKLVAGLLGLGFDELRQRERQKLLWQRVRTAALSAALVGSVAGTWQVEQLRRGEQARAQHLLQQFDRGRQEALDNHPARAATLLGAAYAGGLDTPALRLLLHASMASIDPQTTVRVHHDDDAPGVAIWLPGSQRFVTLWKNAKVWDARSGALLATLGDSEYTTGLGLRSTHDGRYLMVEGQHDFTEDRRGVDLYDLETRQHLLHFDGRGSANELGGALRSFAPDSGSVALVGHDGRVVVYATRSGRPLFTLPLRDAVSAGFSADGRALVTAGAGNRVDVWDGASGAHRFGFASGQGPMVRAFFAPDGRIVVIDAKGKIKLRSGADGRLLDALGGHTKEIKQVQFSADGRRLLTNAEDGARVWDLASGDQLLSTSCNCGLAVTYDLDATGTRLLARIDALRVGLWDVDAGQLVATLAGHSSEVNSMLFSPDGMRILTAGIGGDAVIWDTQPIRTEPARRLAHEPPLVAGTDPETYSGRYSPDGRHLVTTGTDGTARLWDAADGRLLHVLRGHTKTVYHAAFSPDGRLLATASDDLTARLWDVETGRERAVLGGHARFVRRVVFSPDGRRLLTVAGKAPRLWDTADGRLLATLAGHTAPAVEGGFSRDGRRIVTTGLDGQPRVFDADSGAPVATLVGHAGVVPFAAFVDGDRCLITAGVDGSARLWDAATGRQLALRQEPLAGTGGFRYGSLSHDGRRALLSASTGELLLWDWRADTVTRLSGHSIASYWSEFSSDDRLAVSASNDGTARIWSLDTGTQIAVLRLNSRINRMWSAGFDPAAEHVVTAGYSEPPTAEIWDFPRETRTAVEIAAALRCKSPWQVEGDHLVARRPEAADCAPAAPAVPQAAPTTAASPPVPGAAGAAASRSAAR